MAVGSLAPVSDLAKLRPLLLAEPCPFEGLDIERHTGLVRGIADELAAIAPEQRSELLRRAGVTSTAFPRLLATASTHELERVTRCIRLATREDQKPLHLAFRAISDSPLQDPPVSTAALERGYLAIPRVSAEQRRAVAEWAQILGLLVMLMMALREFRIL